MYPNAVGPAWIMITDHKDGTPSSGCVIRNNLTTDLSVGTGVVSDHTIKFTSTQFSTYFADYAHFDFRLKSGCAAIDSGSATLAPSTDIAGTARPQNGRVDIGAYEYSTSAVRQEFAGRSARRSIVYWTRNGLRVKGPAGGGMAAPVSLFDCSGRSTRQVAKNSYGILIVQIEKSAAQPIARVR